MFVWLNWVVKNNESWPAISHEINFYSIEQNHQKCDTFGFIMATSESKSRGTGNLFRRVFRLKFLLVWLAVGCFMLTRILHHHHWFTERWYSRRLYPHIARTLIRFSDQFSFSLNSFFAGLVLFVVSILILTALVGKLKWSRLLVAFINLCAVVYLAFYALWGFNYYREPLYSRMNLQHGEISDADYELIMKHISRKATEVRVKMDSVSTGRIDTLVDGAFRRHAGHWSMPWLECNVHPKQMFAEAWLAKANVYGYYGVFFNEVHVSRLCTRLDYTMLLAHERVHRLGITGEAEANFYAWLLCYKSESPELRYAAHVFLLRNLFDAGYGQEFMKPIEQDSAQLKADELEAGWFKRLTDRFLKFNQVENGLSDYGRMIEPTANYLFQVEDIRNWDDRPTGQKASKRTKKK